MKLLFFLALLLAPLLSAAEKPTYEDHIYPILEQSCLNCHNPDKKKGDLDLSSFPALLNGSSGGKIAIPGDSAASKLYTVTIGTAEPTMPPKGDKIERQATDLIRSWIDNGMLETKNSTARKPNGPKFDLTIKPSTGKPEGPPPMPQALSLDPTFVAPRAGLVKAMTTSPWAPLLALTGQKQILLYHSENFRFLGSLPFPKGQPESLTFHPSGQYLLASGGIAGKSGSVVAWDIVTGKELFQAGKEFDSILAAALTPDLKKVTFGGPSRLLKIWDPRANEQTASIKKHPDWITSIAASSNGKFFASGDRNGGIHIWDTNGNEIHALRDHQSGITSLAFRSDSKLLASTGEDGQLIIWDLKKGIAAQKIMAHGGGITALHYHRNGKLVTAGRDHSVKIFKSNLKEEQTFKKLPQVITAIALSQNETHLFTADFNGQVLAYDLSSQKNPIATLESNPPTLQNRLQELRKKLATQSQQVALVRSEVENKNKQIITLKQHLKATETSLNNNQNNFATLKKENAQNRKKSKELAVEIKQKQTLLKRSRNKKQTLIKQLKPKNKQLPPHKENLQENLTHLVQNEKELIEKIKNLQKEQTQIQAKQKNNNQKHNEIRDLIKTGQNSLKDLQKELSNAQKTTIEPHKKLTQELANEQKWRQELNYWEQAQ